MVTKESVITPGDLGAYKALDKYYSDCFIESIPNYEALLKRGEILLGDLSGKDRRDIKAQGMAMAVSGEVIKSFEKSMPEIEGSSEEDAANLEATTLRDLLILLDRVKRETPEALKSYEESAKALLTLTNEEFDRYLEATAFEEEYHLIDSLEKNEEQSSQTLQALIKEKLQKHWDISNFISFEAGDIEKINAEELSEEELYSLIQKAVSKSDHSLPKKEKTESKKEKKSVLQSLKKRLPL